MSKRPKRELSVDDVRRLLADACSASGGQKSWGDKHKVSQTYISVVLSGRTEPGPAILEALGLERVTMYRYKS